MIIFFVLVIICMFINKYTSILPNVNTFKFYNGKTENYAYNYISHNFVYTIKLQIFRHLYKNKLNYSKIITSLLTKYVL